MDNAKRRRWVWAWLATATVALMMVQVSPAARATQQWLLALNGGTTDSGDPCGGSYQNPWDGTGDYLFGTYYDTGNSGLTFKYSYNNGADWETPGSPFGDQQPSPPYYIYLFSNGVDYSPYQMPTWTHGTESPFIIRAIGGSGVPDFTCTF